MIGDVDSINHCNNNPPQDRRQDSHSARSSEQLKPRVNLGVLKSNTLRHYKLQKVPKFWTRTCRTFGDNLDGNTGEIRRQQGKDRVSFQTPEYIRVAYRKSKTGIAHALEGLADGSDADKLAARA